MHFPSTLGSRESDFLMNPRLQNVAHQELAERLRKTLHYGNDDSLSGPSLALTELSVDFIREFAPRKLGSVDGYFAASLTRRASVSPCAMILALMYVDRLKHRDPDYLMSVSSSDLFLVSMMMASKYLYDEGVEEEVFSDEWAAAAEVAVDELHQLERDFLTAIDWNLFVKSVDFWKRLSAVEESISWREARRRGFVTYAEMAVLITNARVIASMKQLLYSVCQVAIVSQLSYTAAVLTIAASTACLTCLCHQLALWSPPALLLLSSGALSSTPPSTPFSAPFSVQTPGVLPGAPALPASHSLDPAAVYPLTSDLHSLTSHQNATGDVPGRLLGAWCCPRPPVHCGVQFLSASGMMSSAADQLGASRDDDGSGASCHRHAPAADGYAMDSLLNKLAPTSTSSLTFVDISIGCYTANVVL